MKKSLLILACLLTLAGAATAQQFTSVNDEGVEIHYTVVSTDPYLAGVATGNTAERIVVPSQVEYENQMYEVSQVNAEAFSGNTLSSVKYLRLPSTITFIGQNAFFNANFDSIRIDAQNPPDVGRAGQMPPLYKLKENVPVFVPCGTLANYRNSAWAQIYYQLRTDCSFYINAKNPATTAATVEGSGYYEAGDTVALTCVMSATNGTTTNKYYMLGWSDGCREFNDTFVATHDDTITALIVKAQFETFQTNNISTLVSPIGVMAYDGTNGIYNVPADGEYGTIFASTLWISGHSNTAEQTSADPNMFAFSQKFAPNAFPGPLKVTDGSTTAEVATAFNRCWTVSREEIDNFIAHVGEEGYEIPEAIMNWPGNGDSTQGYAAQLAPYYDANHDGRYRAVHGDYPLIKGDKATYVIYNDNFRSSYDDYEATPMKVEIHAMFYAFDEPGDTSLNNTLFVDYTVYNRSERTYDNATLTMWVDFDLGYAYDDFLGTNVSQSYFYCYNGDNYDEYYGEYMPAQNCVFLRSSVQTANTPVLYNSMTYINSNGNFYNSEPTELADYYNYSHSTWRTGTPLMYGGDGYQYTTEVPCRYIYPGDSDPDNIGTNGTAMDLWSEITAENTPGDRRGLGSTEPFTMMPGEGYSLSIAYTTAFANGGTAASIEMLKNLTQNVQRQFDYDTTDSGKPFTYQPYSPAHEVGIAQPENEIRCHIYPNPAKGSMTVECQPNSTIVIYDMNGAEILRNTANSATQHINIASLHAGVYLVRIGNHTEKLVVLP